MKNHLSFFLALVITIGLIIACGDSKIKDTTSKKEDVSQSDKDNELADKKRQEQIKREEDQKKKEEEQKKKEEEQKKKEEEQKKKEENAPAITVDGMKLCSDYKANEVSADNKYNGKKLKVTGIVSDIRKVLGDVLVDLETGSGEINCWINSAEKNKVANLKKGDDITITGKCTGTGALSSSIQIKECKIIEIRKF